MSIQRISVVGLGKLGACMAATFAARGFEVVGIDINAASVAKLNSGQPPVDEPRLAETLAQSGGRLRATTDAREAAATDATFFIVPSPSLPDGSFTNEYLLKALAPVAQAVRAAGKKNHLFVCSSTTTPGTLRSEVIPFVEKEIGGVCGKDFGFCYNPEFIALGDVVRGLLAPDLVLIGESDKASGDRLAELYTRYNTNQPRVARMSITSAELTKISINSYITAKISFTNQLSLIAAGYPDTDIHAILDAIGSDSRIGKKYLKAGLSFGGPCFPRDNRLIAYAAKKVGLPAPLAVATDDVNELTKEKFAEQVKACVKSGDTVAVLGMAYRPDTAIVEESAALHLAQSLARHGCRVVVHDYCATPANCPPMKEFTVLADPAQISAEKNLKAIVIANPSAGYKQLKFPSGARVFDPWGLLA